MIANVLTTMFAKNGEYLAIKEEGNKVQPAACFTTIDCVIIMADKHTSETHYLSLKEKVKSYAQSKRFYFNRAFGSYCYHSIIDGNTDAGATASQKAGKGSYLSVKSKTMGRCFFVSVHSI